LSTDACEFGGCDHKFKFLASSKTTIDGLTTAYDNWILAYPGGILGQHDGATTYAVMGNGQAVLALIFAPSASKLQVY
jgi:hypothetical protein